MKIGDVVTLKSSDLKMTIIADGWLCKWVHNGEYKTAFFDEHELRLHVDDGGMTLEFW